LIFKIAFNGTSTIQSFFTSSSACPLTVEPYQAVDVSQIHGDTSGTLLPINSFLDYLDIKGIKRFYIHRTFALGDILQLVPVVRALRKQGYDPYLKTIRWAKPILDLLDIESVMVTSRRYLSRGEYGIMMDWLVEQDHRRAELSCLHRVDIYFKALGVEDSLDELDWSMNMEKFPSSGVKGKYIALQTTGANSRKRLSFNTKNFMVKAFKKAGIPVVIIGEGNMMPLGQLFAVIAGAKCLVTMDSGPLWISHFTKTPVIAIFGPTRPAERLTYHPLWPEKAIGIRLNEKMDPPCESCFENMKKCNGRVDCLKISGEQLYDLIHPYAIRFLEAGISYEG